MNTQAPRSKVEGVLHRLLPVSIKVRSADPEMEGQERADAPMRLTLSVSSEEPYLRQGYWDEPWIEVLGHKAGEVDLSRFQNGAGVVLANHDRYTSIGDTPLAGIGAIEGARLLSGVQEVDIAISRREALADLRQDILDGLVRNASIGYLINERVLVRQGKDGEPSEYRVTDWMPFEISLVDIPADATVGLGRSLDAPDPKNPETRYRVIALDQAQPAPTAGAQPSQGERMDPKTTPAGNEPAPTRTADVSVSADPMIAERARMRDIAAIGRQFNMQDLADQHIGSGTTAEGFRSLVLGKLQEHGKLRQADTPEIGMSQREIDQFSFRRALLAAADPANARKLAPFEMECADAANAKRDQSDNRVKERAGGIFIPADVLSTGISVSRNQASALAQSLARMGRNDPAFAAFMRDLNTGTASQGGNLVATEVLGSSFIELLRKAMILDKLGVTFLRDLNGNLSIPSHAGAATHYWVAEGGAPTESQPSVGAVSMTPKTIAAYVDYTRRLLVQSSIDVEMFVRMDLARVIALGMQDGAFNGTGSDNQPTGLFNIVGIGSVAMGTNGGAPTYETAVDLETKVANSNADVGTLAFVTNSKVRGKLRKTQEFASTNGKAVWGRGRESGIGDVLGYDAYVTNTIPSNLDKGTSTGVCSAMAFGNWADLIVGMWGGLDLMLDPYSLSTSGGKRLVALQDVDFNVRHVESFAVVKDLTTT